MRALSGDEIAQLLPYGELATCLHDILRDRRSGRAYAPERLQLPLLEGGHLIVMPAVEQDLAITKLVTVHPRNGAIGLETIQGEVIVIDTRSGTRRFLLEGAAVTARRTAALSLLAAQLLAPRPQGPLLLIGAGVQAQAHLDAFVEVLGVQEVYVTSRTLSRAQALADHGAQIGAHARIVDSAKEVLATVTMIVTATSSARPVLDGGVGESTFVAAVGSHRPDMAELSPELVRRSHLCVDTLEGARSEAGDFIQADVDWSEVTPLEQAEEVPRLRSGPIVFKSVGDALWDLAAVRLIDRRLRTA